MTTKEIMPQDIKYATRRELYQHQLQESTDALEIQLGNLYTAKGLIEGLRCLIRHNAPLTRSIWHEITILDHPWGSLIPNHSNRINNQFTRIINNLGITLATAEKETMREYDSKLQPGRVRDARYSTNIEGYDLLVTQYKPHTDNNWNINHSVTAKLVRSYPD